MALRNPCAVHSGRPAAAHHVLIKIPSPFGEAHQDLDTPFGPKRLSSAGQ
jgi:hypothetical protein